MQSPYNAWFDAMQKQFFGNIYLILNGLSRRYYGIFGFNAFVAQTTGDVRIYVDRLNGDYGLVTVDVVAVDGTAVRGVDYTMDATTTLTWVHGDTIGKYVTIGINSGRTAKSFSLRLQNATGYAEIDPAYDEITITIPATVGPAGLLSIGTGQYTGGYLTTYVKESTTLSITVRRTRGATGAIGCSYHTTDGTATAGVNYTDTSGTLSWADGETADKTISVPILTVDASGTYFTLTIDTPTGDVMISTQYGLCRNYIYDVPALPGQLQFNSYQYFAPESAAYTFTVYRLGGSTGAISVNYGCTNGTASSGTHYTAASGTLNWADGETTAKTFDITILSVTDDNRTFLVSLSSPGGGASLGDIYSATVYIRDSGAPIPTDIPSDVLIDPMTGVEDDWSSFHMEDLLSHFPLISVSADIHCVEANAIAGDVIGFGGGTASFGQGTDLIGGDNTLGSSSPSRFVMGEM